MTGNTPSTGSRSAAWNPDGLAMLCWVPYLVPVLCAGAILWLQPAEHMGPPEVAPTLGRLVYDDWDTTAFALRGLNAHLGRTSGLADEPDELHTTTFATELLDSHQVLKAGYYLEYPHPCLLLFRLGYVWQSDFQEPPPVVCDSSYRNLVQHLPHNDSERRIWGQFRRATRTYVVLMAVCLLALMVVLRVGYEPGAPAAPVWLLLLPGALYFALNRFDMLPTLLTALSLACLGRRRLAASAALLAAATAFKVYPAVMVPLVLAYLWRDRRAAANWACAFAATLALSLLPTLLLSGWDVFWGPYRFQLSRLPFPPTIYGYLLPYSLAGSESGPMAFRLGTVLAVVGTLCLGRMRSLDSVLRRSAMALIVFVSVAVFYSPQWILWLAPLLLPLAASQRWLIGPIAALDIVTYLTFPVVMDYFLTDPEQPFWLGLLVYLRFAILGILLAMLAWAEFRPVPAPFASATTNTPM